MKPVLLLALLWTFISPLHAQIANRINFIHLGVNEGLSQNTVFDITQDKQGNMWFATYDGLNRYDGYDFTVYQNDEQNPYSIGSNIIRVCTTDSQGRLWAGTHKKGCHSMMQNRINSIIIPIRKIKKNTPITNIVEVDEHRLFLFTDGNDKQLLLFDTETRRFSNAPCILLLSSVSPTTISRQGDNIYIGSYQRNIHLLDSTQHP